MDKKRVCAQCQYCTYEQGLNDFYCHNEKSDNYGKIIKKVSETTCDSFSKHIFNDLSFEEALKIVIFGINGVHYYYHLPDRISHSMSFLSMNFKDNADMAKWCDAFTRVAIEYMRVYEKDG